MKTNTTLGRIIAIDYGTKRVGLAVTDPHRLIATPLTTVPATNILSFLKDYIQREYVTTLVVGLPNPLQPHPSSMQKTAAKFADQLRKLFKEQKIFEHDERYTSKLALASLVSVGSKKKYRQDKAVIDKVSATLILQSFLASHSYNMP
ncbi:MAG: Holliday junction resolvase RuvX [Bacteroidota bacterium]